MRRQSYLLVIAALFAGRETSFAQSVTLAEAPLARSCFRNDLSMDLNGKIADLGLGAPPAGGTALTAEVTLPSGTQRLSIQALQSRAKILQAAADRLSEAFGARTAATLTR